MAQCDSVPTVSTTRFSKTGCLCLLLITAIPLSACQSIDTSWQKENFNRETRKANQLGSIFVNYDEKKDPYEVRVERDRPHRGYAVQAPLYKDDDGLSGGLRFSKSKEYDWFSGLQFSFEF